MENLEYLKHGGNRSIHVRCPECFKLFAVKASDIHNSRPKFTCNQCQTRFWLSYPECLEQEAVIGFRLDWIEKEPEASEISAATSVEAERQNEEHEAREPVLSEATESCPKCGAAHRIEDLECGQCGIIFSKFALREDFIDDEPEVSQELRGLWQKVLEDYEDQSRHEAFTEQALREDGLDFAAKKYSDILEASGTDELAERMLKSVSALIVAQNEKEHSKKTVHRKKRVGMSFRMDSLLLILSTMVVVVGYFVPGMRNLIGFGVAMLFLVLALKYYFRVL